MIRILAAAVVGLGLVQPATAPAQDASGSTRGTLVVTAAWLAQHLHDPDLVVLQIGAMNNKETYDAGHIPGARALDYDAVHGFPKSEAELAARRELLESAGISDNSRIVLYNNDDYWPPTTRTLLSLNYTGLRRVQLLDGGLKGARTLGHRVILYDGSFADWVRHDLPLERPKQEN
jgi:thiosulfate/3-mercaptopyruvate sulfurtransferase